MAKKRDPKTEAHIHKDLDVTPERVRAFGKASYQSRLEVLAHLRRQANDRLSTLEVALAGLLLGFLTLAIAPSRTIGLADQPWWGQLVTGLALGVMGTIALAPVWIPQLLRHGRQERAYVWLAAYEDEIARRAAKGK